MLEQFGSRTRRIGMTMQDVVKVQGFITRTEDLAEYRKIRNEAVGDARPAHTLLVVAALGQPEWLVELEAIAAPSLTIGQKGFWTGGPEDFRCLTWLYIEALIVNISDLRWHTTPISDGHALP